MLATTKFFRQVLLATVFLAPIVLQPTGASAQISVDFTIGVAPPPLVVYAQPPIPGPDYIWSPGYWAWGDDDYYWVPGTWVLAPEPGLLWTPGYWGWRDGYYGWSRGYWGPHVGFYGGISYGYGYGGVGYEGGYWNNGRFFYNRSVNNIQTTNITNVYNKTVVVNNTTNNVSFNGGTGGVRAMPTPAEQAASGEHHVAATGLQTQHEHAASQNQELRASVNHGNPPVAATASPGHFSGHGIVAAAGVAAVGAAAVAAHAAHGAAVAGANSNHTTANHSKSDHTNLNHFKATNSSVNHANVTNSNVNHANVNRANVNHAHVSHANVSHAAAVHSGNVVHKAPPQPTRQVVAHPAPHPQPAKKPPPPPNH